MASKSNPSASPLPAQPDNEAAAVWVDIKALKPWDRNPRKNQPAVKPVADSIKRFGFGAPILARRADGEIIAGHTRILAAESLGLTRVPVRYLDLDPADAHLLALADNKLNEKAEWDDAEVGRILSEYGLEDAALAGWDSVALDELAGPLSLPDEDKEPYQQMIFHLHDDQVVLVKAAIDRAIATGERSGQNENRNGDALWLIARAYMDEA